MKRTENGKYLTPKETHQFITQEAASTLLIDARTPAEVQFVGYTDLMDANVPYIIYDYSAWDDKAKDGDKKGQRVVNGWKNECLPWTYNMNKAKAYYLE